MLGGEEAPGPYTPEAWPDTLSASFSLSPSSRTPMAWPWSIANKHIDAP